MDLFDLIGPVMIGPSSSHTAGAARIGMTAYLLLGEDVKDAVITFHGSFAKTYHGHGTDRAIVGGLMGLEVDDPRLRDSIALAEEKGLNITFRVAVIRGAHPNTVRLELKGVNGAQLNMEAASIGGGNIEVTRIDGFGVVFAGKENTLIVQNKDMPGLIANVTGCIAQQKLNIANMQVFRRTQGTDALMVLELDSEPSQLTMMYLRALDGIESVTLLKRRAV